MQRTTVGAWLDRDVVAQPRDLGLLGPTITQVAWQIGHLALVARFGDVPLEIHIDTLKTGVASGAGAVITPPFQTFTRTCGFSVDPIPHELIG